MGEFPDQDIDHKDGDRSNNKWDNLREATRSQNCMNSKIRNNNTSGHKGVSYHKRSNRYRVIISGKHRGLFDTPEEAARVATAIREREHAEFARL